MGIAAEPPRVLQSRDLAQLPQMRIIMRRFPVEKIMNARIQDLEPPDQTDLQLGSTIRSAGRFACETRSWINLDPAYSSKPCSAEGRGKLR